MVRPLERSLRAKDETDEQILIIWQRLRHRPQKKDKQIPAGQEAFRRAQPCKYLRLGPIANRTRRKLMSII